MNSHSFACLLPVAWIALASAAPVAPVARPLDLAPFGQLSVWGGGSSPQRFPDLHAASAHPTGNLGLEWREERDVQRVHVQFAAVPKGLKLQYWFHTWPAPPPESRRRP